MPILKDFPQVWWEIISTYDGDPGNWAMSAGNSEEDARKNILGCLAEPEKAMITSITPIGKATLEDALSGALLQDS